MKLEVRLCMHGRSCKNHLRKWVCVNAKFEQTEHETVVNSICACSGGMFLTFTQPNEYVQIQAIFKFHRKSIIDHFDSINWKVAYQEIP